MLIKVILILHLFFLSTSLTEFACILLVCRYSCVSLWREATVHHCDLDSNSYQRETSDNQRNNNSKEVYEHFTDQIKLCLFTRCVKQKASSLMNYPVKCFCVAEHHRCLFPANHILCLKRSAAVSVVCSGLCMCVSMSMCLRVSLSYCQVWSAQKIKVTAQKWGCQLPNAAHKNNCHSS